jgi:polyphosphate glucokinase
MKAKKQKHMTTLVIDVGGTHIKVIAQDKRAPIKIPSGPGVTAEMMATEVLKETAGWKYDHISIGFPGPVHNDKPAAEPHNLGPGWVDFPYKTTFGKPVRMINDAAMQALGSYRGHGHMLFLGLGTGLGAALVVEGPSRGIVQPLELAHLPYKNGRTYEDYVGLRGLERMGKKKWRKYVLHVIETLSTAMVVDYVMLGGGNAKLLKTLPKNVELGANDNAFLGGFKLWESR